MTLHHAHTRTSNQQSGFTVLETMIAALVLLITIAGLMSLFAYGLRSNRWQGDLSTRTIEYAQDKMEQLLGLTFTDTTANTTVFPACVTPGCTPTNGTGLAVGGGTNWQSPVTGYVDYLDFSGNQLTSSTGAAYVRVWKVEQDATGKLKKITVVAAVKSTTAWNAASTTLVCFKTSLN